MWNTLKMNSEIVYVSCLTPWRNVVFQQVQTKPAVSSKGHKSFQTNRGQSVCVCVCAVNGPREQETNDPPAGFHRSVSVFWGIDL